MVDLNRSRIAVPAVQAAEETDERNYLAALKEDLVLASVAAAVDTRHKARLPEDLSTTPEIPINLTAAIAFLNTFKALVNTHLASTRVHIMASVESITTSNANDQTSADLLATEIIADVNTHYAESGVHISNETTSILVNTTDGSEGALLTTCESIRTNWLLHVVSAMSAGTVE